MQATESNTTSLGLKADRNIEMPAKKLPDASRTSKVLALDVGNCYSEAARLPVDQQDWNDVISAKNQLSNWMPKVIARATARQPESKFQTSVGEFRDRTGAIIVTAVITRIQ